MKSQRTHHRTPNDKVTRYLHRIQQLIGNRNRTPTRNPSPISQQHPKTYRQKNIDNFLKYELTCNLLLNFFQKRKFKLMSIFFSNARRFQSHKMEKIFRFVSIQKQQQHPTLIADAQIAAKIMNSGLKNIVKRIKNQYMKVFVQNLKFIYHKSSIGQVKQNKTTSSTFNKTNLMFLNAVFKNKLSKVLSQPFYQIKYCYRKKPEKSKQISILLIKNILEKEILKINMVFFKSISALNPSPSAVITNNSIKQLAMRYYQKTKRTFLLTLLTLKKQTYQQSSASLSIQNQNHSVLFLFHILSKIQRKLFSVFLRQLHTITIQKRYLQKQTNQTKLFMVVVCSVFKNYNNKLLYYGLKSINFKANFIHNKKQQISISSQSEKISNKQKRLYSKQFLAKIGRMLIILPKFLVPLRQSFQKIDFQAYYNQSIYALNQIHKKMLKRQVVKRIKRINNCFNFCIKIGKCEYKLKSQIMSHIKTVKTRLQTKHHLVKFLRMLFLKNQIHSFIKIKMASQHIQPKISYSDSNIVHSIIEQVDSFLGQMQNSKTNLDLKLEKLKAIAYQPTNKPAPLQKTAVKSKKLDNRI